VVSIQIVFGDNLELMPHFSSGSFNLIYIDPPFNTGRTQARTQIQTVRDDEGDRVGFKGNRYKTVKVGQKSFGDAFDDFLGFLEPRLIEAYRLLSENGSFFLHIDYREVHYVKILLDQIFGRECFMNEIIWAYDYGARATKKWSPKHDNILWYVKNPDSYTYRYDDIDRIPYMAPGLVGPEKAERGKTPTDTWWNTIVSPNGKEKTGYPTQKPLAIMERIIKVHSNPGDLVLDFFAGSGSTGEAAAKHGRHVVLMDRNEEAIEVMSKRLASYMDENSSIASEKHSKAQKAQSVASPQVSLFIPGTAAK
jgi:site-specific DNA-methyltransferase (adenine-specific)